jgi:DNA relaxase NicK
MTGWFNGLLNKSIEEKIENAGLDILDYDSKWNRYRIRVKKDDIEKKKEILIELIKIAYDNSI